MPSRIGTIGRRRFMGATLAGAGALGLAGRWPALAQDMAAAKEEGRLVIAHSGQEADIQQLVNAFSEATGIDAVQQRITVGAAVPRFEAEFRTGQSETDVYMGSDPGLFDRFFARGQILQYPSPEIAVYPDVSRSDPTGVWTAYCLNMGTLMYDPRRVDPADAPKSWMDLLDPRWKGQIGFQDSAAGSQYSWWYARRDVMPAAFWTGLEAQQPRGYSSSTQIVDDLHAGNLLIGGKVSVFQYVQQNRNGTPLGLVFPTEGTPTSNEVIGILGATKRPNAAKIYVDYVLSEVGQKVYNEIHGSFSARPGVAIDGLPPLGDSKLLIIQSTDDFNSEARHNEFVEVWNRITGA